MRTGRNLYSLLITTRSLSLKVIIISILGFEKITIKLMSLINKKAPPEAGLRNLRLIALL